MPDPTPRDMDLVARTERLLDVMQSFDVPAIQELAHPELEMSFVILSDVEGRELHGPGGVAEWAHIVQEYFSDFRIERGDIEAHGDWAVFDGKTHWKGKSSGAEASVSWTAAIHWDGDLVREYRSCHTRDEAMALVDGRAPEPPAARG